MAETVAGLVLGVLPLLISAAEHYEDVVRPFKRYKQFSTELKQFQQEFLGHKTVFRNECLLLLSSITDHDTAIEMMAEREHPLWANLELTKKLSDQLGSSREACQATIRLIMEELARIERDTESFRSADMEASSNSKGDGKTYKAWRRRVTKKLNFCISEKRLDQRLDKLQKLNRVFVTLCSQTQRFLDDQSVSCSSSAIPRAGGRLSECLLVRKAAIQLYEALVKACMAHPEHFAHFRLDPEHNSEKVPHRVRFDIAFAQKMIEGETDDANPMWFAVESFCSDTIMKDPDSHVEEVQEAWSNFKITLKHANEGVMPFQSTKSEGKVQKSVRFAPNPATQDPCKKTPAPLSHYTATKSAIKQHDDSSLPDFCVGRNLCMHVQMCSTRVLNIDDTCIGYLERVGPCSHRVYYKQPVMPTSPQSVVSLAQIFRSTSQSKPATRMLQCKRLRLARQLASAVLQFHTTPFLKESWRSEDVIFFEVSNGSQKPSELRDPHLNVNIRVQKGKKSITSSSDVINTNPYTFSLGIILLELAYQAPLRSFKESVDLTDGQDTQYTDFFIADRLSKTLSTELGVPYAKMVRKCLSCDFGQGTRDLNDTCLQEAFYRDVVSELDRLEQSFARIQIG